jgi:hypothetical protein
MGISIARSRAGMTLGQDVRRRAHPKVRLKSAHSGGNPLAASETGYKEAVRMNRFALLRAVRAGTVLLLLGTVSPAHAQSKDRDTSQARERQADPQRDPEPRRQAEPQRPAESPRQEPSRPASAGRDTGRAWQRVGPAWSATTPAWSQTDSVTPRPGQDAFRATPDTYGPRDGRSDRGDRRRRDGGAGQGRLYPAYPYVPSSLYAPYFPYGITELPGGAPGATTEVTRQAEAETEEGFLRLRVRPRTAEVYVDGAYAGTVDDFGGTSERQLRAGTHRVELAARGYERVTFDVRVPARETITFTRDLDEARAVATPLPEPAPLTPITHKAMYIVPHCYAGDTPPTAADLPSGCRIADLRVIP